MGMVYTRRDRICPMYGHLERDGMRCQALERLENCRIFTVDTNRYSDEACIKPGRHLQACVKTWNISRKRKFPAYLYAAFGKGIQFEMIGLDYFPKEYAKHTLSDQFFAKTLTGYAKDRILAPKGSVWLPRFDFVANSILGSAEIQKLYDISFSKDPSEFPLYSASLDILDDLQKLPDGFNQEANCQDFVRLQKKT